MAWAPDYVTAEDLAEEMRIVDDLDEAQLARAVSTASRAVDNTCHRQFGKTDAGEAREYPAQWSRSRNGWVADVDDITDATDLVVAADLDGSGAYASVLTGTVLLRRNAVEKGLAYTRVLIPATAFVGLSGTAWGESAIVRVTAGSGGFGWQTVPVAVEQATLLQASRFAARRDAPFGVAGSPDAGSEMRLLAKVDPDVAVSLGYYCRRILVRSR